MKDTNKDKHQGVSKIRKHQENINKLGQNVSKSQK